jgi:hypothetical protein
VPENATPPEGGETNDALWPDFVSAYGRDGVTIAGYIPKRYLLGESTVLPGSPSNPPQPQPEPVYGEDLTTLVGHMVPGVGFVALGSTNVSGAPSVSFPSASVAPSPPASAPPASGDSASPGMLPPAIAECGRVSPAACARAIVLARAGNEAEVAGATRIVVDDVCPPTVMCDRIYPFDSVVVFVTAGADTTGWYAFEVVGPDYDAPTKAQPWMADLPAHVVELLRGATPETQH